jgi:hypothetical protein
MQDKRKARGVVLPDGHTGSSLFHAVLKQALARYPEALGSAHFPPNAQVFKREYGRALARLEAARCASKDRAEIARFIVQKTLEALVFVEESGGVNPLLDYLRTPAAPVKLQRNVLSEGSGLAVEVPFEGKLWRGREVTTLAQRLFAAHQISRAACDALAWLVDHAAAQGGRLSLHGQRFALFGAGAELSPARQLLRAGASVLWIDLADPASLLGDARDLGGVLVHSKEARDLLREPHAVLSAISEFAAKGPVHIGMFAYAGGESQEWRLGAAMNAITASLDPELVRSVSLLVSPTSPGALEPESVEAAETRRRAAPLWQRALALSGILSRPGHFSARAPEGALRHAASGEAIALATVSIQGLSYQAAQYIAKICAAETYAVHGTDLRAERARSVTVSANVGGVTRTRSLSHPVFEAAFAGASRFGVHIFDADTTRALGSYLMLHDLLNPGAPGAARASDGNAREHAAGVHAQQVHGGLYGLPYELEGVIRCAAVLGAAQKPSLLWAKPKATKLTAPESEPAPSATKRAQAAVEDQPGG